MKLSGGRRNKRKRNEWKLNRDGVLRWQQKNGNNSNNNNSSSREWVGGTTLMSTRCSVEVEVAVNHRQCKSNRREKNKCNLDLPMFFPCEKMVLVSHLPLNHQVVVVVVVVVLVVQMLERRCLPCCRRLVKSNKCWRAWPQTLHWGGWKSLPILVVVVVVVAPMLSLPNSSSNNSSSSNYNNNYNSNTCVLLQEAFP